MEIATAEQARRIRELNDAFRNTSTSTRTVIIEVATYSTMRVGGDMGSTPQVVSGSKKTGRRRTLGQGYSDRRLSTARS
jgi:hypothetical protein